MNCPNCGAPNADGSRFCTSCGTRLAPDECGNVAYEPGATDPASTGEGAQQGFASGEGPFSDAPDAQYAPPSPGSPYQGAYQQQRSTLEQTYPMTSTDEALRLANFVLCVISCIAVAVAVIPLAWLIPMTVHSWGIYKGTKPNTVCFGVCTLIFANLIGGILLLVSNKDA